ncbi:acetylornithine deacetylase [Meridianimarinicoccus roseus]|jgi:acetylornithine deacetylase|uniref:Acetylornithine deacetylase n=1 Tax=Meridianimarinicoccus roseus TaxID=2072018 RepID=A0A2V2LMA3_9RHOB|nr:acetylornithine deacetylase [Meridianimarinicoccus roseus]PWR03429.1 acetylornithine deacetylase [Meridianimarinicoccus roseus]
MTRLRDTIDLLDRLVAFPTVSSDSNLEMIATLAHLLEDAGARCEVLLDAAGAKANLFATIGPEAPGGIVLSGHSDVVPVADQDWTGDPFIMRSDGQHLYGRGTCDMKGFIACAVTMAPDFAARPLRRPIHFAFTHDEEVGCLGAQALCAVLAERAARPAMAIIGEPTQMQVIDGHKGCCEYTTRFEGLEGHGSNPDGGVNAVEYAARYATRLLDLRERLKARAPHPPAFDPPHTTINIGALVGGVGHNVIAGKARVDWEMRPVQPGDAAFVHDDLDSFCREVLLPAMQAVHGGAEITTEVIGEVAGLQPAAANAARDLMVALTGRADVGTVPFGTEAGLFQALGLSAVVCGPGAIAQAHKPDEFIEIAQLDRCLAWLDRLGAHAAG